MEHVFEMRDWWQAMLLQKSPPPYHLFWSHAELARIGIPEHEHGMQVWWTVVQEYSKREMAVPSDKLIAISAIAEEFSVAMSRQRNKNWSYLAGLWRETLIFDLLWVTSKEGLKPRPKYRAPSWSWASVDGTVYWNDWEGRFRDRSSLKIVAANVKLASPSVPFGSVTGAHLAVNGMMKKMSCEINNDGIILRDPECGVEERGCLDVLQQDLLENGNDIWILQVLPFSRETDEGSHSSGYSLESKDYMHGLILLMEEKDIYSRIGSLRVESKEPWAWRHWEDSFKSRTITII